MLSLLAVVVVVVVIHALQHEGAVGILSCHPVHEEPQKCTSKGIWRQGIGSFCKEFLRFNTMPCRRTAAGQKFGLLALQRPNLQKSLCPVVICSYLCSSELPALQRTKHDRISVYLRPPFLGTPLAPSRHPQAKGLDSQGFDPVGFLILRGGILVPSEVPLPG